MSDNIKNCPICSDLFVTKYTLHLHCMKKHASKFVCCPICYEPFKCGLSNADLVMHSDLVHKRQMKKNTAIKTDDFKPFTQYRFDERMIKGSKCMVCSKCLFDRTGAIRHYKNVHLAIKYLCHRCPRAFTSVQMLGRHYHTLHGSKLNESHLDGFTLSEEAIAVDALQKVKITINRAKSSTCVGMRLLCNPCQVKNSHLNMGPLLNLTYRNEKGVVKLHLSVMNDHNELVDLTS